MPTIISQGAGSAQGFGFAARASGPATYVEDVFSIYTYAGTGTAKIVQNGVALGSSNAGGSVFFDNSSDCYASVPCTSGSVLDLNSVDWTVECFVFFNAWNSLNNIFGASNVNNYFGPRSSGTTIEYQPGSGAQFNFACSLALNTWYHIALTKSGSSVRCFVAGTQVGSTVTSSEAPFLVSASPLRLGAYASGGNNLNGNISNFRVTKGAALYTSNFTPPSSALTSSANTSLLTFQGTSQFADNSSNILTVTQVGTVSGVVFGPFNSGTGLGGLVWIKSIPDISDHFLFDTVRGANQEINSNTANATTALADSLTSFNINGFTVGGATGVGVNGTNYMSYTFRKQPKFFDIVTYTGNGGVQTINHNLGSTPGAIWIKRTDSGVPGWICYHQSIGNASYVSLNGTTTVATTAWNSTSPTATNFTLGNLAASNASGGSFTAYLFASNAGGFGDSGTDNIITCGTYTGTGVSGNSVNLGYEPQYVMIRRYDAAGSWYFFDNVRPFSLVGTSYFLANTTAANATASPPGIAPTATGFVLPTTSTIYNASGGTYSYIAIRRGPMKAPTRGASVYKSMYGTGGTPSFTTTFPVDMVVDGTIASTWEGYTGSRLQGGNLMYTNQAVAETTAFAANMKYDYSYGWGTNAFGSAHFSYIFSRAPKFFDIVCYTGDGVAGRAIPHNLTVAPELMIIKCRTDARAWTVYHSAIGPTKYLVLNTSAAPVTSSVIWNDTAPTATNFIVGYQNPSPVNGGDNYVAYLFASCPGVSKIGSYTGSGVGTINQVNCGFTSGARFVMIKRADSTGSWYVWDSTRGIVAGNDPYILLDVIAAQVTNTDYIDAYSAGFEVSSTAPAELNANGSPYIYLAIA